MKKKLIFLMILLFALALMTGCTGTGRAGEDTAFHAQTYMAGAVKALVVDVRDRRVEVAPSADNQVHLSYAESSREFYDICLSETGVLTVAGQTDKAWTDYFGGNAPLDDRTITVLLPVEMLDAVTISTTNEDIAIESLAADGIELRAVSGSVLFDHLCAGSAITLEAKNGSVKGTVSGHYEDYAIACRIKKGDSNLPVSKTDGAKTLSVTVNNGDVEIAFAPAE